MDKQKRNSGITLIALVISIIVMLILAGVSLNATIGDNGIITNAQNAKIKTGIAVLEEFLQEKYVEIYDYTKNDGNKILSLINNSNTAKYFYKPNVGALQYVVDSEGHALYLINKSNLPDEVKDGLVGGDAGNGEYADYAGLNDVYGVTTDLKVYYCSKGLDSLYGISKENLDKDDPKREVFPANSPLANLLGEEGKPLTADDVKSVIELTLNADSKITSLSDFYNLTSLKKLILDGIQLDNLDGIENCTQLDYVYFQNYSNENITIKDYSALSGVKNLTYLYLLKSCDKQINDLCEGIKDADFPKLQYLRIMGYYQYSGMDLNHFENNTARLTDQKRCNITNIDALSKLSSVTKNAVEHLFLNHTQVTDISSLSNFNNLQEAFIPYNNINSLKGLENKKNLKYIFAYGNKLGNNESENLNSASDSLASLSDNTNLFYLDIRNNSNLKNISYLSSCKNLKYLFLTGCPNIYFAEIGKIKNILSSCKECDYDSKYGLMLIDEKTTKLKLNGLTISKSELESLKGCINLTYLNLENTKLCYDNTENALSQQDVNSLLNSVLQNFTKLEELSLNGQKNLTDGRFLKKLTRLKRLDVMNTGLATGSKTETGEALGLENLSNLTTLVALGVNNGNTDLSLLGAAMSHFKVDIGNSDSILGANCYGIKCDNETVWKTLEKCTNLNAFYSRFNGYTNKTLTLDLSRCTNMKYYETQGFEIGIIVMPDSLISFEMRNKGPVLKFTENSKLDTAWFSYWNDDTAKTTLENCKNSKVLKFLGFRDADQTIIGLKSFNFHPSLETITVEGANWHSPYYKYDNINVLNNLSGIQSLKNIYLNFVDVSDLNFMSNLINVVNFRANGCYLRSLFGIENLTGLRKIEILQNFLTDISAIENLTELTYIDFNGNQISNILPLAKMTNLTTLNLENNAIYDFANGQSNLEVLANLHTSRGGKLTKLLLNGNNITDFSKVSSLTWPNGKSGF